MVEVEISGNDYFGIGWEGGREEGDEGAGVARIVDVDHKEDVGLEVDLYNLDGGVGDDV